ncbi:MAG: hypothetical protein QOE56_192 [Solirubrobacterales bacterium]|jgi:hypothetical protein|nr:hypothetical protein [Solirubrobacterales bacterium]
MGVVPIVLLILAMKIPIFGLIWLVWWAGRAPQAEAPGEAVRDEPAPRRPEPWRPLRGPRRRGPHGGAESAAARKRGAAALRS